MFSLASITFLVGIGLIIVAVLGGGIEVREVKIANMKMPARLLSFAIGVALLAATILRPDIILQISNAGSETSSIVPTADRPPPSTAPALARKLTVNFGYEMDQGVSSVRTMVFTKGVQIGTLNTDTGLRRASFDYSTSHKSLTYSIKTWIYYSNGAIGHANPEGVLALEDGATYQLQSAFIANEWTVRFARK